MRSSVGFSRRSAISAPQRWNSSGMSFSSTPCDAFGSEIRIVGREGRVHDPRPQRVFLLGQAHEARDHARDDRLGHVGDQIAAVAALEAIEHVAGDVADALLVVGDPLRREATLEERLDLVVAWRVHADEHRPRELQRKDLREHRHAAQFRGVGLPVAADRVHVLGRGHRPEAGLRGVLLDLPGPVHRALGAHLLEQLVRRAVLPQLALGELHLGDVPAYGSHARPPLFIRGPRGGPRLETIEPQDERFVKSLSF